MALRSASGRLLRLLSTLSGVTGRGPFADLIARRFNLAYQRLGFTEHREPLDTTQFVPPRPPSPQGSLF